MMDGLASFFIVQDRKLQWGILFLETSANHIPIILFNLHVISILMNFPACPWVCMNKHNYRSYETYFQLCFAVLQN